MALGESWIMALFTVPVNLSLGLKWADVHSQRPSRPVTLALLGRAYRFAPLRLALCPILQCLGLLPKPQPLSGPLTF